MTHTHTMTINQNKHESFKKLISFTAPHCTVRKEQNKKYNIMLLITTLYYKSVIINIY